MSASEYAAQLITRALDAVDTSAEYVKVTSFVRGSVVHIKVDDEGHVDELTAMVRPVEPKAPPSTPVLDDWLRCAGGA